MKFPTIHWSHGNSFPAKSYSKMLRQLQAGGCNVGYLDRIGHNPKYPVTDGWPHLVDELVDTVESRYEGEKVIALGHSLGGWISFMGAIKRPDLFKSVIMLDSIIMSPLRSEAFRLMKQYSLDRFFVPRPPRRREWGSHDEAKRHFQTRLHRFDTECLEDFCRHALEPVSDGDTHKLTLSFQPHVEHSIAKTVPHHVHSLKDCLQVPTGFIGGRQSRQLKYMGGSIYMEKTFSVKVDEVEGTHLFPLEYPVETAQAVLNMIKALHKDEARGQEGESSSSSSTSSAPDKGVVSVA